MASTLKIDTVTTPDGTGNITFSRPIVADGSNLTNLPASGKILQCLSAIKTDTQSTSSTSFVAVTDLSISITPSATSSKVLVMWNLNCGGFNAGSAMRVMRDSTAICIGDANSSAARGSNTTYVSNSHVVQSNSGMFLDSPSSSSALAYSIQFRSNGNTDYVNRSSSDSGTADSTRTASTITVMEVGA